ncbi:polysaccharide deacetylase family protein [Paenibacillus sonchi]|uniref:polysaccharide deacetylase family protein n=1 Tax=Paenibacillus sonchi TaxID=373687 RepID=UPI001E5D41A8|nr:polysaccharide deacetylase family protein [Paenibacillus sonchi]MCE3203931.1 polysaccharide deacetylase family protein [Paenibacillus sonchi]
MPLLEQQAALIVELLSLEHKQDGYQLEVGLTGSGGFTRKVLLIDEFTYLQMNMLASSQGHRVRLSLYPKWDPFRRTYFSSLIKMNSTYSETLYFACSEAYVSQLLQLKQLTFPPPEADAVPTELPSPEPQQTGPLTRSAGTFRLARPIVLRCILFSLLFVLFFLRMDGTVFNSAEAHEDFNEQELSARSSVPVTYVPVIHQASFEGTEAEAVPVPETGQVLEPEGEAETEAEPEAKPVVEPTAGPVTDAEPDAEAQSPLVETLELDGSSYEYSLAKGYVALSFDDGPSKYTQEIVDILLAHGVAANFLFIGQNAQHYPQAVRYADEHGMPVGSHSWDHSDLTKNSSGENHNNLLRSVQVLEQNTGRPVTVFRPPYGAINGSLAAEAGKQKLKVLLWNRDPEDWKADTAEQITRYFHNTDPSGGIYLLHEKAVTVKALPAIIEYLKSKQLKFAIFR